MSYILDALRKADAERERSPARGIHAQAMPPPASPAPAATGTRLVLGAAVAVAVLGAIGWQFGAPRPAPVAVGNTQEGASLPAPPEPPALSAAPAPPATAVLPAPPAAVLSPVPAPAPATPPAARTTAERAPGQRTASAPQAVSAPAVADKVLDAASALPADVQRELPKLVLSGGIYSENPAQRMLIVNGQVVGEGAEPAPGLVLEQIRARTAVFSYRGYRYLQGF